MRAILCDSIIRESHQFHARFVRESSVESARFMNRARFRAIYENRARFAFGNCAIDAIVHLVYSEAISDNYLAVIAGDD